MAPTPTDPAPLVLLSRVGCCLCEGLEEKLRALAIPLERRDVDADPALQARYGLEVPVLLAGGRELPRVSPRLGGDALRSWLRAQGVV
ncbi:MAG: glutaredoxin family protein [Vulcanococcus sp.]